MANNKNSVLDDILAGQSEVDTGSVEQDPPAEKPELLGLYEGLRFVISGGDPARQGTWEVVRVDGMHRPSPKGRRLFATRPDAAGPYLELSEPAIFALLHKNQLRIIG